MNNQLITTLTKEQQERFKELYLQDYSASLIFEKLGYSCEAYAGDSLLFYQIAAKRMRYYRIKLGLPKRGTGHIPKHRKPRIPIEKSKEAILKRIDKISVLISNTGKKIENLKEEREYLQEKLKNLEVNDET